MVQGEYNMLRSWNFEAQPWTHLGPRSRLRRLNLLLTYSDYVLFCFYLIAYYVCDVALLFVPQYYILQFICYEWMFNQLIKRTSFNLMEQLVWAATLLRMWWGRSKISVSYFRFPTQREVTKNVKSLPIKNVNGERWKIVLFWRTSFNFMFILKTQISKEVEWTLYSLHVVNLNYYF